ncbi:MAG: SDR family oxidoreductase [Myxococcota bacterium]|nr:SDR family oxidoreductase [Myxococcota bacterium]
MAARLAGKVAIITGAGQGVGRGIALAMARQGARCVIADMNPENGHQVQAEIEGLGGEALFVACDVTRRDQAQAAVDACLQAFGQLDILVNNAQRAPIKPTPLMEHTDEIVDLCFNTGFRGTLHFMQAAYPHMRERGGRIINLGSGAGLEGMAGQGAYGAAKEAIRALSKTAAREWGPEGIHVNVLCPLAKSPGVAAMLEQAPEMEKRMTHGHPIARVGECEEDIGGVAVFLASEEARYITGQTLMADGGALMIR